MKFPDRSNWPLRRPAAGLNVEPRNPGRYMVEPGEIVYHYEQKTYPKPVAELGFLEWPARKSSCLFSKGIAGIDGLCYAFEESFFMLVSSTTIQEAVRE